MMNIYYDDSSKKKILVTNPLVSDHVMSLQKGNMKPMG